MMKFDFDTKTVEQFTEGDCWVLAWELHVLERYPVWTLCDDGRNARTQMNSWRHVVVQIGKDQFLDVEGIRSAAEMQAKWGCTMHKLHVRWLRDRDMYVEYMCQDDDEEDYRFCGWYDGTSLIQPDTMAREIVNRLGQQAAA